MSERRVAAPILSGTVGVDHARHASVGTLAIEQAGGSAGQRVRLGRIGKREQMTDRRCRLYRRLRMAVIELAAASASNVGEDTVDGRSSVLATIETEMQERAP